MSQPLVLILLAIGLVLVITGIAIQRRAIARHGTPQGKRAVVFFRPRAEAIVTRWFETDDGLDMYFQGQAVLWVGLVVVVAGLAYAAGRGW